MKQTFIHTCHIERGRERGRQGGKVKGRYIYREREKRERE